MWSATDFYYWPRQRRWMPTSVATRMTTTTAAATATKRTMKNEKQVVLFAFVFIQNIDSHNSTLTHTSAHDRILTRTIGVWDTRKHRNKTTLTKQVQNLPLNNAKIAVIFMCCVFSLRSLAIKWNIVQLAAFVEHRDVLNANNMPHSVSASTTNFCQLSAETERN